MALMASRWGSKYPSTGQLKFSHVTHTHTSKKWGGGMDGMDDQVTPQWSPQTSMWAFRSPSPSDNIYGSPVSFWHFNWEREWTVDEKRAKSM